MHETSLGNVIRDYLTGETITETTFEEFRQALARMLVEEKGYPRENIAAKTEVAFPVAGQDYARMVDFAVYARPAPTAAGPQAGAVAEAKAGNAAAEDERAGGAGAGGGPGAPLILIFFCAGEPGSFDREIVAAARLWQEGPVPLALVTDTKTAVLKNAATGETIEKGFHAIPDWEELNRLAGEIETTPLTGDRLERERRLLYTYSEFVQGTCCQDKECG